MTVPLLVISSQRRCSCKRTLWRIVPGPTMTTMLVSHCMVMVCFRLWLYRVTPIKHMIEASSTTARSMSRAPLTQLTLDLARYLLSKALAMCKEKMATRALLAPLLGA